VTGRISNSVFDFFEGVLEEDDELGVEIKEWRAAHEAEGSLIPNVACHTMFSMSRQAWERMPGKYGLTEYEFFGKKWYSSREIKALYKLKRQSGGEGKKLASIVRDVLQDARE